MSWAELFDRAAAYDVSVDDVREALGERRADSDGDDGGVEEGDR